MPPKKLPEFSMTFEPMTIKHLGLRLYSTLPPVISELVSNAFDAESPKVEVNLPVGPITDQSEVAVRDFGHGLDAEELQLEYLPIGRDRREATGSTLSRNGKVKVTGRKGLGKLASFGVAEEMQVRAFRGGQAICLRLAVSDMIEWAAKHKLEPYKPTVVADLTGETDLPDGVEVRLRKLFRRKAISPDDIRRGLAHRLTMIGKHFSVRVNGSPIKPEDRLSKTDCAPGACWDVNDIPGGGVVDAGLQVTGWVGFLAGASSVKRGIDIFASGKAVELGSFFNYGSTHAQFARAHLCGSIAAEFLDDSDDLVATARNSVVWESEVGQKLQEWGERTLRWAFDQWVGQRQTQNETKLTSIAGFDKWMLARDPRQQRIAKKLLKVLVRNPETELPLETAESLLEIVKSSVEELAFHDLVEALDTDGDESVQRLLQLFDEWRVIEARQHLRLADGRLSALEKLDKFIKEGALEVQAVQPLFVENLWLIDAAWSEADVQLHYTKMLRESADCREPKDTEEVDRRLDIFAVTAGGTGTIVELKRPEKTLSRKDLDQLAHYADFARTQMIGSGPDSPKHIGAILLVGKLSSKADVSKQIERLAGDDIRVQCYTDLYARSRRQFGEVEKELKRVAPEYARTRRKKVPE